jgi:hypothetical protein
MRPVVSIPVQGLRAAGCIETLPLSSVYRTTADGLANKPIGTRKLKRSLAQSAHWNCWHPLRLALQLRDRFEDPAGLSYAIIHEMDTLS